jgi:tRNA G18 (ribose-2'-O)-methylase SpoU
MLSYFTQLPERDIQREGYFIAEGALVVRRLLRSSLECRALLSTPVQADELRSLAPDVPLYVLSKEEIAELVGFDFHRGVLALGVIPPRRDPEDLMRRWLARPTTSLLLLPHCSDPQNLGALVRSARALDFDGVIVGERSSALYARRTVRVAMGSMFDFDVIEVDNFAEWLRECAVADIELWALHLSKCAKPLDAMTPPQRVGLILGNEGAGVSEEELRMVDEEVIIPMATGTDSLNITASGAIAMYAVQQRGVGESI